MQGCRESGLDGQRLKNLGLNVSGIGAGAIALGLSSATILVAPFFMPLPVRSHPLVTLLSPSSKADDAAFIRPPMTCPTAVEPLTDLLLRDVPDYGNRVSQRSRRSNRYFAPQSHILTASRADIDTLDPRLDNTLPTAAELQANGLDSIFFTTLERQYLEEDVTLLQHYHWAFLTQTRRGWQLAFMFSRLGDYPATDPPTPPRDSNQGVIAEAIRLWLRDCEAGAVDPPSSNSVHF